MRTISLMWRIVVALALLVSPVNVSAAHATLRGDVNLDRTITVDDVIFLIDYLLYDEWDSGAYDGRINEEACARNADTDLDGTITIDDVTELIEYLLNGEWFVEPEEPAEPQVFTLLHLSDSHGFAAGLQQALVELDADPAIDAMLFTGDWTGHSVYNNTVDERTYAITTPEVDSAFMAIKAAHGDKLLMLTGNHDAYDNPNGDGSQWSATRRLKIWMTQDVVNWGDPNGVASYWHKDYPLPDGNRLRIIALDQYENSVVGKPSGKFNYKPIYSQAQIDWLVERLKELTPADFLIIALHEPAYQDDTVIPWLKPTMNEDSTQYNDEPEKLFVSERLTTFNYKGDTAATSINLLPRIMDAYLKSRNLTTPDGGTLYYKNLDKAQTLIPVNADFEGVEPCRFLFYIGGHRHCDICSPLPEPYGDQLMIHVTAADWTVPASTDDDLLSYAQTSFSTYPRENDANIKAHPDDPDYRINRLTLDLKAGTVTIERIGAQHTAGGRLRNNITFRMSD